MFVRNDSLFQRQAKENLITIDFHNIETGVPKNERYGAPKNMPIHTITGVMSDELKLNMDTRWNSSGFTMNTIGLKTVQDFVDSTAGKFAEIAGNQSEAYNAGPFSSQKYKGLTDIKFNLKFTSYADAEEMLGFSIGLSSPLECLYWLMMNQLPKEGRGMTEQMVKQITGVMDTAADGIGDVIKLGGKMMADKKAATDLLSLKTLDNGMAKLNANPGNWINQISLGDMFRGWFVINNVQASMSKEKYYDGNTLYITFSLSVTNYMIPDKAALVGAKEDIVTYKGPDNADKKGFEGISEFSKMYILNGNRATKEQREVMSKGASGMNRKIG